MLVASTAMAVGCASAATSLTGWHTPASVHPPPLPVVLPLLDEAPPLPVVLEAPPLPLAPVPVGGAALGLLHDAATSAATMPQPRSHALVAARRFAPARMLA
jgi:hypothetical protein